MNLFENVLFSVILILFPFLICIIYEAYNKVYNLKKSDLYLDLAIISSFYLVLNFKKIDYTYSYLLMNIPLIIAYLKDRKKCILLLSILCFYIKKEVYQLLVLYIIIEYVIYFILSLFIKRKKIILNIYLILNIIFYFTYESLTKPYLNNLKNILNSLIIIIPFILVTYIAFYTLKKANKIINFQRELKNLQEEKELRLSLFKITHEIKNPIAVCKGYLEMFDYDDKSKSKKYIKIMDSEIKRVLFLLEDFLSIDKIKIEKDIIDINLLLEEVTSNFIPLLKENNIDKQFIISEDEIFIEVDYNRITQVLINVLKNSIEAIGSNGLIKLYVKKNKNNIEIVVEDTGIGMTKEELKKISEPFFSTKDKGTGLGIYLSKQIIEAHDGTINYKSKKYSGTKTIIKLPYKEFKF